MGRFSAQSRPTLAHTDSRYLVSVPVLLNLATLIGFCVIMAVVGGQCLSSVADGNLSVTVGIVITAILTLGISFCGFTVLHIYERYAWIPAIISIIVAVGTGGKELRNQVTYDAPPPVSSVLSFGMIVASYMVPWACLSSDFTTYLKPDTSSYAFPSRPPLLHPANQLTASKYSPTPTSASQPPQSSS